MTNFITRVKEWAGTFLPLTPDQGPQPEIVDRHSPLDVKKRLAAEKPTSNSHNFEKMTKRQLEEYARKEFNVELDRRHNKKRLINQVKKLKK